MNGEMTDDNNSYYPIGVSDAQISKLNMLCQRAVSAETTVAKLSAITEYFKEIYSNEDINKLVINNIGLALSDGSVASDNPKIWRRNLNKYYLVCGSIEGKDLNEKELAFIEGYKELMSGQYSLNNSIIRHEDKVLLDIMQDVDSLVLLNEEVVKEHNKIRCFLKIADYTLVVDVDGEKLELPTVKAGLTEDIIKYAMNHAGREIEYTKLCREFPNNTQLKNKKPLTQIFAKNIFNKELKPFSVIRPRSMTLLSEAFLTQSEIDAIKKKSMTK